MSEQMQSTEPAEVIVLSTNHELRDEMESNARRLEYGLQRAYLAWVAMGLGERELNQLVNLKDPKRVVQEAVYANGEADFKKMGLQREAIMPMMELPPNWREFEQAASGFISYGPNMPSLSHFEIVKGEVVAKPSLQAWIDSRTLTTITHPKQIRAYRAAERLAKEIKEFEEEYALTVIPKPGDAGIFSRGVLVRDKGFYANERVDYSDILLNKVTFKSIKTDE